MSDNQWDQYGDCPESRCAAKPGQPCIDLRRWAIHYDDRQWRHPIARAHSARPLRKLDE